MRNIKDLKENEAIHCPTKKEAKEILRLFKDAKYKWIDNKRVKTKAHGITTNGCDYVLLLENKKLKFSYIGYSELKNYTIIPASEFLHKDFYDKKGGITLDAKEVEHLKWIYDRLVCVYKESENTDFIIRMREILNKKDKWTPEKAAKLINKIPENILDEIIKTHDNLSFEKRIEAIEKVLFKPVSATQPEPSKEHVLTVEGILKKCGCTCGVSVVGNGIRNPCYTYKDSA